MIETNARQLSRSKRRVFFLVLYTLLALLLLTAGELTARLKGFGPYEVKALDIVVEPGGRLYEADPVVGYKHLPGQYRITLDGTYSFNVTNLPNTLRVTHPLDTYSARIDKPEIWLFGDSITYGWS